MRIDEITEPVQIDQLAAFVRTHCQQWITESKMGEFAVWRGIKEAALISINTVPGLEGQPPWAFLKAVRFDREPKDTGVEMHQIYNGLIAQAGGTANRSNSAFAVSNLGQASTYGAPYVFIPVGSFHYTWHRWWPDWYSSWNDTHIRKELIKQDFEAEQADSRFVRFVTAIIDVRAGQVRAVYATRPDQGPAEYKHKMYAIEEPWVDVDSVVGQIQVDRGWVKCVQLEHEMMIHCKTGLYVSMLHYVQMLENLEQQLAATDK